MRNLLIFCSLGVLCLLSGCRTATPDTLLQISSIPMVEQGRITGHTRISELKGRADFGFGHAPGMSSVVVMLDGTPYLIGEDGNPREPNPEMKLPLLTACSFFIDTSLTLPASCSLETLRDIVNRSVPDPEMPCAIKVYGRFSRVAAQVPLRVDASDLTESGWQPTMKRFPLEKVSGTLIGFRIPQTLSGAQRAGFHFAFIADNLMSGGLVDNFVLVDGTAEIDVCMNVNIELPPPDGLPVVLPRNK